MPLNIDIDNNGRVYGYCSIKSNYTQAEILDYYQIVLADSGWVKENKEGAIFALSLTTRKITEEKNKKIKKAAVGMFAEAPKIIDIDRIITTHFFEKNDETFFLTFMSKEKSDENYETFYNIFIIENDIKRQGDGLFVF